MHGPGQPSSVRQGAKRWAAWLVVVGLLGACAPAAAPAGQPAGRDGPGAAQAPAAGQTYTMKFGFATINDMQHEFANRLKERVEARSGGRLRIEVYPASQLGNNQRMIEGVQLGTQEATIQPPEFVYGVDPRYVVLSLPFLFDTVDEANRVLEAPATEQLINVGEAKGLKGLGVYQYGFAGIIGHFPIRSPEDLRGRKVRVLGSQIELDTISSWGGTGVPMALSEVTPALQQRTVDGVVSGAQLFAAMKLNDIARYYTPIYHYLITSVFFVNKGWYERLPADLQQLLVEQSKALQREMSQFSEERNAEALKLMRERPDNEVVELTPQQRDAFRATAPSVWEKYFEAVPNARPLFESIRSEVQRARGQ
jgi:TRAP-type C4-dicarboxylate transport system substrate-binding protein